MFTKRKVEDQYDKILNTKDIELKALFLKKQIEFFKSQKPNFEYDYKNFLTLIEPFYNSKNYESNILWLQTINEIIKLNSNLNKKYFKKCMKIIFQKRDDQNFNKENIEEINNTIIDTISITTNNCKDIFQCDTYFQNFKNIKNLLQLLIVQIFPYHYNMGNNKILLLITNIFLNINKNKEKSLFLNNNYFCIIFKLFIEILCFICLHNSFKIIDAKNKSSFSIMEITNNQENIEEKKIELNSFNKLKNLYLDLINKSNKLFDLYLKIGEKNNFELIINYKMLMKIFIIHCLESQYNESYCIEWFKRIYNNFRINKILKIITDTFDDEIFDLFYINENLLNEEKNYNKNKRIITSKNNQENDFFYLTENHEKEIELKNSYYNFISKFNKLRKKLIDNKEFIYNGLFVLINLLFNEILSKEGTFITFNEECIIISLIKCVMKYMTKTSVIEMLEDNKNSIDNIINILIDRFGFSLSDKIWKELMILIKYFYFELIKIEEEKTIKQLSRVLKKMIRLKVNRVYLFDEQLFYDLINKVCENKKNDYIINDFVLFSVYFKNKFKSLKNLSKNISSVSKYFISLIKENYTSFESQKSIFWNDDITTETNDIKEYNLTSEKKIEIFAYYILVYFSAYSKYENKSIESFLSNNLNYLNFYFSIKKDLQHQYINLVINVLNNTSDLNYFQYIISYIISLHSSESEALKTEELIEKSLYLYKKIIIKLMNKLSLTYQIQKLNYLFESIYNRLNANLSDDIDYNFLKNILEIFSYMNVTKYNEILINNKIILKKRTTDIINKYYSSIGKNIYSSIASNELIKRSKKDINEWCFIDIKELFNILIRLVKKKNFNIEFKVKIINFINYKINDIFFFNKINIGLFVNYVLEMDKENLSDFLLYLEKNKCMLTINEILKNIVYLMICNKNLFDIKDYEETYEKIFNYIFDKINFFKKLIRLIINKYNIKVIKNKNWKHFVFMKNLLGIDDGGMPNILNLRLDSSDFKFNNKDRERDINYQIFMNEEIEIDKFVYPKINLKEMLNYLKSYFDILEISLNSLISIHIKNINLNNNIPFLKQIERELKISFDTNIKNNLEEVDYLNAKNENISIDIKNKYQKICDKLFTIFNKFPSIIKYQNNFLYDIYKLFLFCKDFIIFCGEKYIIHSILLLFSISFSEYYQKLYDSLNNEFKFKCNNGKDFLYQKIESIQINENLSSSKTNQFDKIEKRMDSAYNSQSNSFLRNNNNYVNYEKLKSEPLFTDLKKIDNEHFVSKSVINLQNENTTTKEEENIDRQKSSDECNMFEMNNNDDNKESKEPNKMKYEKIQNKMLLIRKLLIEFIINSKHSLKILHIINNILNENEQNKEEGTILFLLLCKWRIINEENLNRREDTNIFKNRINIKNYFNKDLYDISFENTFQNKTAIIKSPISSFNYIINNNYKNIQNKGAIKILTHSFVPEKDRKNVENIFYEKYCKEGTKQINYENNISNRNRSNSQAFKSSSNILNEIKELEDEDNNLSNSGDKNSEIENEGENNLLCEDINNPNLEELISIMYKNTKNNTFKLYENELNKTLFKFNSIDRSLLYNELTIYVSYIINRTNKVSLFNLNNTIFMKFLKKLTIKEESNILSYTQIKLNEQKEFILSDSFNITKYILNSIGTSSEISNCQIYLIFNDTLQNKSNKVKSLIKNNIDINNDYIYLYIFIIPVSEKLWKFELRLNKKKSDIFSTKLENMLEKNFLKCYYFSIENNFGYIIYHLKILFSLLQDFICTIKIDISDKKMRNKLTGIKHEEMIERMNIFKSINTF